MTKYTIRPNLAFTINQNGNTFTGGQVVDLSDEEFEIHRHKLEGTEINFPTSIVELENDNCFPEAYVISITPEKVLFGSSKTIEIKGSFFTPDTTVSIDGSTVGTYEFVNSHFIKVSLEAGNVAGIFDMTIDNGKAAIFGDAIEIFSPSGIVVDLRLGGTEFGSSAIEMRSTMNYQRLESGLVFSGNAPWGSWARFVGDEDAWVWNRDAKKTLSWIYQNTSNFMIGIGSRATNESNDSQFYQGEVLCYNFNGTTISSIYGNDGTIGNGQTQSSSISKSTEDIIKIVFRQNGELGSLLSIYKLPSSDITDWFDTSNKKGEFNLIQFGDEPNIMPFAIPQNGNGSKLLGFVLEDQ